MRIHLVPILLLSSLATTDALAEGGCPLGQVPQQGNGWRACVPSGTSSSTESASEFVAPTAEARWVSLAVDNEKGVLAKSSESRTEAEAHASAEENCVSQGGVGCSAFITAKNGCVTVVASDTRIFGAADPVQGVAERRALDECQKAGAANCYVHTSACVKPIYK